MPLTSIDPTPALIVVDLQKGLADRIGSDVMAPVARRSADLAAAFRKRGWPVVLVNASGRPPGRSDAAAGAPAAASGQPLMAAEALEIMAELDPQPGDLRITKQRWGSFTGTTLDADLRERGVTQVFVTGVATSIGVESTARSAHELGYHVVLAVDAMLDLAPESHAHSVQRIFPRLGETTTTSEILTALG
jgi:nicotinamidase-related amidase